MSHVAAGADEEAALWCTLPATTIRAGPDVTSAARCEHGREGRCEVGTFSHEPAQADHERPQWSRVAIRETWGSLAIMVMWVTVAVDAVYGPDIVSSSGYGGSTATVPSAVVVALFAFLGSWIVAKYCFGDQRKG
jgi:hypothetical protein